MKGRKGPTLLYSSTSFLLSEEQYKKRAYEWMKRKKRRTGWHKLESVKAIKPKKDPICVQKLSKWIIQFNLFQFLFLCSPEFNTRTWCFVIPSITFAFSSEIFQLPISRQMWKGLKWFLFLIYFSFFFLHVRNPLLS